MDPFPNFRVYEKYAAQPPDLSLLPSAREDVTAAAILRPELARKLAPECRLLPLEADDWVRTLGDGPPAALLLAQLPLPDSGWTAERLREAVRFCRGRDIPTVLWDTDGPENFAARAPLAEGFDHLLAADPETLRAYRRENYRRPISCLCPGVQLLDDGPVNTVHFGRKDLLTTPFELVCLRETAERGSSAAALGTLLAALGHPTPPRPGVTVLTATNKLDSMDTVFGNYDAQLYEPRELVVILNSDAADLGAWRERAAQSRNATVIRVPEAQPLGRCLNTGIDCSSHAYITKFDDDNYYAPNFLTDLVHAFSYAGTEIVGKLTYFCYFEAGHILALLCPGMENRYVTFLSGSGLLIRREVFDRVRFGDRPRGCDSVFLRECLRQGVRMFSADRFNYVYCRRASKVLHTCKVSDATLLRSCQFLCHTEDFRPLVTV